jgi:hypothetical protein
MTLSISCSWKGKGCLNAVLGSALWLAPAIASMAVYPFSDNFESGIGHWTTSGGWGLTTARYMSPSHAATDSPGAYYTNNTDAALTLAASINLIGAIRPALSFFHAHALEPGYDFGRVEISTNDGVSWLATPLSTYTGNLSVMTREQLDLSAFAGQPHVRVRFPLTTDSSVVMDGWYVDDVLVAEARPPATLSATLTNRTIRLRFIVRSEWGSAPDQDLFLDNIGIGEPAPGAPTLAAPANFTIVGVSRPTLVVTNAVDYQGDPLTYRFEVYADPALSNLVAQVPAIASGPATTAWTVDTDLPNNAQYWWRCRATDGTNTGPWMATATFFVNETNRPPVAPVIAGPPPGLILTNLDVLLLWYPSAGDPDEGDHVVSYHIQVADNPAFALPVINATNIPAIELPPGTNWVLSLPLNSLPGAQNLVWRTLYHWRISAQDQRGLSSAWSAAWPLQYGPPAPRVGTLTGLRAGPGNQLTLEWTGAAGLIYVEFSHTLNPPQWHTVAGLLSGTNWTFRPLPGSASGFYRLRCD